MNKKEKVVKVLHLLIKDHKNLKGVHRHTNSKMLTADNSSLDTLHAHLKKAGDNVDIGKLYNIYKTQIKAKI